MATRKISFFICLLLSTACLAAGYGLQAGWPGAALALVTGAAWLAAWKYPAGGLPYVCLLASVGLAVAGQLSGAVSGLMIAGSGLALASWDLALLESALRKTPPDEQTRRHENSHLRSLALALAAGLLPALAGHWLSFELPFVGMIFLIALALFGFEQSWKAIRKNG